MSTYYVERVERKKLHPNVTLTTLVGVLFGLILAYSVYYHVRVEVLPFDDAYITYRYVANFLAGYGLVYNPSERVFGSTTPLYVLWALVIVAGLPRFGVWASIKAKRPFPGGRGSSSAF